MLLSNAEIMVGRNGLSSRDREQKVGRNVAAAIGAYLLLCFLAPLLLPEETVTELSCRANELAYDRESRWGTQDPGENAGLGHGLL